VAITDAVVPVGGLGTRLLPATRSQPKEMLPIVDKPIVQYVVEELIRAGISRVLFVTGRRKRAIEDHFDADPELDTGPLLDPRTGLQILYTRQARPGGMGDALRYGESFAQGRPVVVAVGDAIIETPPSAAPGIVRRLIEAYEQADAAVVFAVREVPREQVSRYGIAVPRATDAGSGTEPFEIADVIEKPDPDAVPSRLAVTGRYVFGPQVFAALRDTPPDAAGEVQIADAFRLVLGRGERVLAVPLGPGEERHDAGSVQGYCETFVRYALSDPRFGAALRAYAAELLDGAASCDGGT
jgi:UTP--glucose-1-phosphate uridylyltransferase